MKELELDDLGNLVAKATNAVRYKFFVLPQSAGLTADALKQNPAYASPDLVVSGAEAKDAEGKGVLDLKPFRDKFKQKLEKMPPDEPFATFVIGYPASGEHLAAQGPPIHVTLTEPLDWEIVDEDGKPQSGSVEVTFANGKKKVVKLDDKGKGKLDVPRGECKIRYISE